MIFLIFAPSESTSNPATEAEPDVFRSSVVIILMVVLLPAQLGPKKPKNSPSETLKEIPFTALVPSPYVLASWDTSIIPVMCPISVCPAKGLDINYIVLDTESDNAAAMLLLLRRRIAHCN